MVEQHPRIEQQVESFGGGVTILGCPLVLAVVLEVAVAKVIGLRSEIVGPHSSGGVNPERVVTVWSVNDFAFPGSVAGGLTGDSDEGFHVGLRTAPHIHPPDVFLILDGAEEPVVVEQPNICPSLHGVPQTYGETRNEARGHRLETTPASTGFDDTTQSQHPLRRLKYAFEQHVCRLGRKDCHTPSLHWSC